MNLQRNYQKLLKQIKIYLWCLLFLVTMGSVLVSYSYIIENSGAVTANTENPTEKIEVRIPKGASTIQIAEILKEKSLIENILLFRLISKINGYDGKYQEGLHFVSKEMSYKQMAGILCDNPEREGVRRFTVPEGLSFEQVVAKLSAEGFIDRDLFIKASEEEKYNYKFLEGLKKTNGRKYKLEGYLFPDTYEVDETLTEKDIIDRMLKRFNEIFEPQYYERAKELNMTIDQVITLASIIEREAQASGERAKISSVFHNRLNGKQGGRLESCATVQYVLGTSKEVLSTEDTKIDSPYNTYINPGLPPGPICFPGKAAIQAALYPEKTDYLFFVAKGDGTHVFSRTYAEHLNAEREIRRRR